MKKEVQEVREQSLAMELLQDYKKANKRFFIIWLVTFIAFIVLVGYVIYLHNDIGAETTTTESYDVEQESGENGNNNFVNGIGNEVNNGKTEN